MTAATLTLTSFLLARIAEDQAHADAISNAAKIEAGPRLVMTYGGFARRLCAECESKRRIVEGMRPFGPIDDINADEILRLLALPYADHADYRAEWRP